MSAMHNTLRSVVCAALLALVAGCTSAPAGTAPSGTATAPTLSSSASPSRWDGPVIAATPAQAQAALVAARAMWAAGDAATGDYRMTVTRSCECLGLRTDSEVSHGKVKAFDVVSDPRTTDGALPDAAGEGMPRTVPELFALVAASKGADAMTVVFDRFGVPVHIGLDPSANAVDDEKTLEVSWSGPGQVSVPDGAGPWVPIARMTPIPGIAQVTRNRALAGNRAFAARDARGTGVYLTMLGSSSCPAMPLTLTVVEPTEPGPERVAAAEVLFGSRRPAQQECTSDLGQATYWAPLPAGLAQLDLVLTSTSSGADSAVWIAAVTTG